MKKALVALVFIFSITTAQAVGISTSGVDYNKLLSILNPTSGRPDFITNVASVSLGNLFGVSTRTVTGSSAADGDVLTFNQWATSGTWVARTPTGGSGGSGGGSGAIFNGIQTVATTTSTILGAKYAFSNGFTSITVLFDGVLAASHTGVNFWSSTRALASVFSTGLTTANVQTASLFQIIQSSAGALSLSTSSLFSNLSSTGVFLTALSTSLSAFSLRLDISTAAFRSDYNVHNGTTDVILQAQSLTNSTVTLRLDAIGVDTTSIRSSFNIYKGTADLVAQINSLAQSTVTIRLNAISIDTTTVANTPASVAIYDESASQGSATALNFVGSAISAACTGSTCTVTVTASGGAGGAAALFIEPYSITVSTLFFPRGEFNFVNGTGISTITWRGSTGTITAPQIWASSATFRGFVKISSLTSLEGFGIAQSSGLEVGNVQFTFYMTTVTTAIDFLKIFTSTVQTRIDAIQVSLSTTSAAIDFLKVAMGTTSVYNVAQDTTMAAVSDRLNLSTASIFTAFTNFASTSDAQQTKFVNFRSTTDALARPSLQNPATGFFNMNQFGFSNSSGIFAGQIVAIGSMNVQGVITSSMGFLVGASTIQGGVVLEGGSITFRNGTNEFTWVAATGGYSVGDRLIITQVSGTKFTIGSGKANAGTGGAGATSNASLQSPATGPYNLNGVGAIINSTGVYTSSGSWVIGTSTPFNQQTYMTMMATGPTTVFWAASTGGHIPQYYFDQSSATINVATVTVSGALIVGPAGGGNSVYVGSISVIPGSDGNGGGGISASSYTVRGTPIVSSTWSYRAYDGFVIAVATGSIPPNSTRTFTASQFGFATLGIPMCMEMKGAAAPTLPVFLEDASVTATQFQLTNPDLTNIQKFACWVTGRPSP